jgi:hypothetical protein
MEERGRSRRERETEAMNTRETERGVLVVENTRMRIH